MSTRFDGHRVQRGLIHFGLGKIISASCGFVAMVLVVRALTVQQFAHYSVLVALIEVITALSGFGISHALLRYVPELYARHYTSALRQFILGAVSLRTIILIAIVFGIYATSSSTAPLLGVDEALDAFRVYLLVVVFRVASHYLSQILESTLHQGIAQLGFSAASILRLAGMVYLVQGGETNLVQVIWVEAIGDAACMFIMLVGVGRLIRRAAKDAPADDEDASWLKKHLGLVVRFSLSGFAQHLVGLPFGGNTNRLVGGSMFSSVVMANFGFAQSLYEYIKRYLPAQLLVGMVRPVVVARYVEQRNISAVAKLCQGFALINIALLCAMLSGLIVGGLEMLAWVSSGKYGMDALILLAALLVVLALETHRLILEMLAQTVERYGLLVPSNLLLSFSIVPAVLMFPFWGAVGFPIINALALVASNVWVKRSLAKAGHRLPRRWSPTVKVVLLMLASILLGKLGCLVGVHWIAATIVSQAIFIAGTWKLCGEELRAFLFDLLGRRIVEAKG